jgi:hypothetical protein
MEACATSHFWAREIAALGHDVIKGAAPNRDRSKQRRSRPVFPIRASSSPAANLRPGLGWCHDKTHRVARSDWDACPRWEMDTFADCWSLAPHPSHDAPKPPTPRPGLGSDPC